MNGNALSNENEFEELFFCIDVVSQARAVLFRHNHELAAKLERVTDSLMGFYSASLEDEHPVVLPVVKSVQVVQHRQLQQEEKIDFHGQKEHNYHIWLCQNEEEKSKKPRRLDADGREIIVDVLTGEVVHYVR